MTIKEKFINKGNISLFCAAMIAALLSGIVCGLCGGDRTTCLAGSSIGGVLALLGVDILCDIEDLQLPVGPGAGILGIIAGVIITLIIF